MRFARPAAIERLIAATADRYRGAGMLDWRFVRGKLRYDPVYLGLLRGRALPADGRVLDLGCGRGILLALVASAQDQLARGVRLPEWVTSSHLVLHGIEARPREVAVARRALDGAATIEQMDLREATLPGADAAVLLDVLHYLPAAAQEDLLARVAATLSPRGILLIREPDAAGGRRFTVARIQERLGALCRRDWRQSFCYHRAEDWRRLLQRLGLAVTVSPMAKGTPFANVLIEARRQG